MRYCKFCNKPMYTSNYSIWIQGKNYNAHKKCIKEDLKEMSLEKLFGASRTRNKSEDKE